MTDDYEQVESLTKRLTAVVKPGMTAAAAAKAIHGVLIQAAKEEGHKPEIEVMIRAPGEERFYADTRCWCVAWEAGPYDWAIDASMALTRACDALVEPYMGFDLMLYPSEFEGRRKGATA